MPPSDDATRPGLAAADREFFADNGYVVVSGPVDTHHLEAVIAAVFAFLGQDRADPDSWYTGSPRPHGMVQLFQHGSLWANRQNPAIYPSPGCSTAGNCGSQSTGPT